MPGGRQVREKSRRARHRPFIIPSKVRDLDIDPFAKAAVGLRLTILRCAAQKPGQQRPSRMAIPAWRRHPEQQRGILLVRTILRCAQDDNARFCRVIGRCDLF